ncbi:MAG: hypothetical protein JXR70_17640 [Spirochaetales bacterium]|nr:hypothetical protein [Spirochaetales bacterium]
MPGVAGFISKFKIGNEENRLQTMVESMKHERFYRTTSYINKKMGVYIAGVALENSFADCMPLTTANKDKYLFISGECFTSDEYINHLNDGNVQIDNGNASFVLALYEQLGADFVTELNGWYHGIIVDLKKECVILFNDRFGVQKIYYHETEEVFYFASEAKALLSVLPELRRFDEKSLGEYFTYDSVLEFRTLFHNINAIQPSSIWTFSSEGVKKQTYFHASEWEEQESIADGDFYNTLDQVFLDTLPQYFRGEKIGMSLTGGLDTRLIMACRNPEKNQLPSYTFGSMYNTSNDIKVASKVAKSLDQEFSILKLDENFLKDFPSHVEKSIFITDGLADVCKSDEIYMNRIARDIAPIRMTGKFGSQVIRNLSVLKDRSANESLINSDFRMYINQGKETFKQYMQMNALTFMLFVEIPIYWAGFISSESSQITIRSPYLDNNFIKHLYRAPKTFANGSPQDFQWKLIKKKNNSLYNISTDKGKSGHNIFLISAIKKAFYQGLNYMDKAYNKETLPHSLHHFIARADSSFSFLQPEKIFAGHCDFRHYRLWFRKQLSPYVKEILLDEKTLNRPHFNRDYIEKMVNDHINGKANNLADIKKTLTIELINRVLMEDLKN